MDDPMSNQDDRRPESRDGSIDFTGYSLPQLQDLVLTLDQSRFPKSFLQLQDELRRRVDTASEHNSDNRCVPGRYTNYSGVIGWLSAVVQGFPLYGEGALEAGEQEVALHGWRRSWLGAAFQTSLSIPYERIQDVVRVGDHVDFVLRARWGRRKRVAFQAVSAERAQQLANDLIKHAPAVNGQGAHAVREFNLRLRATMGLPVVSPAIVALTVLAYVLLAIRTSEWAQFDLVTLMQWGANEGSYTVNGQWWRLLTTGLLHANLAHLVFNMWALWNIGRISERLFGRLTFLMIYLATLAFASLSTIAWDPNIVSVGASGAIFGVFGAFLAYFLSPRSQVPRSLARQYWLSTGLFVLFNLISGIANPLIDNAAHFGGLFSGFSLGWVLARPLRIHGATRSSSRYAAAIGLYVLCLSLAIWQVKGRGSEPTFVELYMKSHATYVAEETINLRRWAELAQGADSGSISNWELGRRFEQEILPFWRNSYASFAKERENKSVPSDQQPISALLLEYIGLRRDWAEKIIAFSNDDAKSSELLELAHKTDLVQARVERIALRAAMAHRQRALANSPMVMSLRRHLYQSRHQCVDPPAVISPMPGGKDNLNDGPVVRHRLGCQAQQLFLDADYPALDNLMNGSLHRLGDLSDGSSSYQGIVDGLDYLFSYGGLDFKDLLGRTADWREAVPGSVRAELAETEIFSDAAWAVRGHGAASSVTRQAWAIFGYRIEMAAAALEDIKPRAQDDPYWYAAAIHIGLDQHSDREALGEIYSAGSKRFEYFMPLAQARMRTLMPRWGGSYEAVDNFINGIYQQDPNAVGLERYAQLYWRYAVMEGDEIDLFADTPAYWSGMRTGFQRLIKRFPRSDFVLNQFANTACRAGDAETFQELRPEMRTRYFSTAWTNKYSLDACDKKLAPTGAAKAASAHLTIGRSDSSERPYTTLGGVRLGMTTEELLTIKGSPISKHTDSWSYQTSNSSSAGVITVTLRQESGSKTEIVAAIEYSGDETFAPKDVPYLNGEQKADLFAKYGDPVDMRLHLDTMNYQFTNGVIITTRNERVVTYGIALSKAAN